MADTKNPTGKPGPACQRPCMRGDLRLVYDNPVTGKGQVRIVDPRNGRQFAFTEREHRMFQEADGSSDLDEIHSRLAGEFPDGMRASEVTEFFRRLRILGLLAPEGTQAPSPAAVSPRGGGLRSRGRSGLSAAQTAALRSQTARPASATTGTARAPARSGPRSAASSATNSAADSASGSASAAPSATSARSDLRTGSGAGSGTGSGTGRSAAMTARLAQLRPGRSTEAVPEADTRTGGQTGAGTGTRSGPGTNTRATIRTAPERPATAPEPGSAPDSEAGTDSGRGDTDRSAIAPPARVPARQPVPKSAPEPAPESTFTHAPGPRPETGGSQSRDQSRPPRRPVLSEVQPPESQPESQPESRPESRSAPRPGEGSAPEALSPPETRSSPAAGPSASDIPPAAGGRRPPVPANTPANVPGNAPGNADTNAPGFDFFDEDFGAFGPGMEGSGPGMGGGMMGGGPGMMGGGMMGGMGGGMMGGMRGGMMGARGGMMGARGGMMGGMMRGGMAGGGGPGMGGADMMGGMGGPGMMGGMGGGPGMMGGGMMGGRGGAAKPPGPRMPAQFRLFDPERLLKLLYVLFYPLKLVLWAILPLVTVAGLSLLNNLDALRTDLGVIFSDIGSVTQFAIGLFIVNLISRLAQGVAIVAHGGRVPGMGIMLVLGVLPRFYVDKTGLPELDRSGQLWAHGAPLLARLAAFAVGVLVWAVTRDQGGMLPQIALVVAQLGLIMFLITSWPLIPSDGMRWLSTLFNEPRLVPKATMAFKYVFTGKGLPPMLDRKDVLPLTLFAVGALLSMTLILAVLGLGTLIALERSLDGLGVVIFLGMVVAFTFWILALWRNVTRGRGGAAAGGFDKAAFRQMMQGGAMAETAPGIDPALGVAPAAEAEAGMSGRARVVWAVIMVGLLILAFQPYEYEAGGQVTILPAARGQAVARTDGEIITVMVAEGEVVQAGQVLAQLSSWGQTRQVSVTETQLAAAEASLARLLAGAKTEEIELAQRQVESAEASLAFSQAEADRARDLAASGTGSQQAYERALSTLESDLANLEVARANLDLVQSPATANDIAIAQAEVDRLTLELAFQRDELERTRIAAPMDGRIVTGNLQLLTGKYLRAGDPLLEIETTDKVTAEIAVPESDIALVGLGDTVRLKAWGQSSIEIVGAVQAIAPSATDEGYGRVVRVAAVFENPDDFLRSGMTGYAKIDGAGMRAWEAYMRSIRRFFQIEVWSWIP